MYCPQCGRELDLDSGEVRFCRYCGFSLVDTKEALHGYSEQKRTGFSVVTWSYVLLLIVTLLLHGKYISFDRGWAYWLSAILIVVSVSLFASASLSALMPAKFAKITRGKGALESQQDNQNALKSAEEDVTIRPGMRGRQEKITARLEQPPSVTEGKTKRFD
jgi:hypothetical protein